MLFHCDDCYHLNHFIYRLINHVHFYFLVIKRLIQLLFINFTILYFFFFLEFHYFLHYLRISINFYLSKLEIVRFYSQI